MGDNIPVGISGSFVSEDEAASPAGPNSTSSGITILLVLAASRKKYKNDCVKIDVDTCKNLKQFLLSKWL
jgi:hypothetical protein